MRTRIIALPLALALLLLPAAAQGKGMQSVTVCGAGGCKDVTPTSRSWEPFDFGPASATTPSPAQFVRFTIGIGDGSGREHGEWSFLFVPSQAAVRILSDDSPPRWRALTADRVARLQRIAGGVQPYPADRLRGAVAGENDAPPSEPAARVVEVFRPAAAASEGDGSSVPVVAGAGLLALLAASGAGVALARRGRRRRGTAGSTA